MPGIALASIRARPKKKPRPACLPWAEILPPTTEWPDGLIDTDLDVRAQTSALTRLGHMLTSDRLHWCPCHLDMHFALVDDGILP